MSFSSARWRTPLSRGFGIASGKRYLALPDKRMGHAGAIVEGGEGEEKPRITRVRKHGVPVASRVSEIPAMVRDLMRR
jgi:succinyl-CoA synthetase alpha subunit